MKGWMGFMVKRGGSLKLSLASKYSREGSSCNVQGKEKGLLGNIKVQV